jgi:hypothetical protein
MPAINREHRPGGRVIEARDQLPSQPHDKAHQACDQQKLVRPHPGAAE